MPGENAFDVVVVGGANYDYLARGPKLPSPGDTVRGDLIHDAPGGKGANQAVGAARLGARVAFVGRVGCDERGERILAALQREKIDTTHVIRDSNAPTGVALVQVNAAGEKQILAIGGANGRLSPADVRAASVPIAGAKVLLVQLEVPLETTHEAVRIAHAAGVKIVLDPAPAIPLPDELLRIVDVIKPNAGEARVLTGKDVKDRASAAEAARKLLARGAAAAAVTARDEGNLIVWRDGECWLPRIPVISIDATGAGDAFAAALGVLLAEGGSVAEAGAFANAAAALATTVVGAQEGLPTRDAVLALLRRCEAFAARD
jgi:ribokinase